MICTPNLTITISDAVWQFLNKRGEPAEVAKRIIESAWEMDGWNDLICNSKSCKDDCGHKTPHSHTEFCEESCCFDPVAGCVKVMS